VLTDDLPLSEMSFETHPRIRGSSRHGSLVEYSAGDFKDSRSDFSLPVQTWVHLLLNDSLLNPAFDGFHRFNPDGFHPFTNQTLEVVADQCAGMLLNE
jgi:hypothetical protein